MPIIINNSNPSQPVSCTPSNWKEIRSALTDLHFKVANQGVTIDWNSVDLPEMYKPESVVTAQALIDYLYEKQGIKSRYVESTEGDKVFAIIREDIDLGKIYSNLDGTGEDSTIYLEDKNGKSLDNPDDMAILGFTENLVQGKFFPKEELECWFSLYGETFNSLTVEQLSEIMQKAFIPQP